MQHTYKRNLRLWFIGRDTAGNDISLSVDEDPNLRVAAVET